MEQKHLKSWGKVIPLLVLTEIFCTISFAQNTLNGHVARQVASPVSRGVARPKGFSTASSIKTDPSFSLYNPSRDTQVLSSRRYNHTVSGSRDSQTLSVDTKEKASSQNQIVLTGYSSQSKKDFTSSVSIVNTTDLKLQPAANAEIQLQGRAAGVTVINDGRPGQGASVNIRGFASFGGNEPLYIIDGVPSGGIRGLNPNDIETMQVLKDAASASIYGARASNGVVVITTKKGEPGKARFSYNMYYGTQSPGKGQSLLNSQEYASVVWNAHLNSGVTPSSPQYGSGSSPLIPDYILAGTEGGKKNGEVDESSYKLNMNDIDGSYLIHKANQAGTDWYNEITDNAPMMNHSLSLSGGGDRSRYLMSFDYFDQKSIMAFSYYKRYTLRVNTEFKINKFIKVGENLQLSSTEDNTTGNNHEGTELGLAYRNQSIIPIYDIAGNFAGSRGPGLGNSANPYASRYRAKDNKGQHFGVFGNLYVEVDFLKHFTARSSIGGSFTDGNYDYFGYKTYENSENYTTNSFSGEFNNNRSLTWTNTVAYKNSFGKHDINAIAGTEFIEDNAINIEGRRVGFFVDDVPFRTLNTAGTKLYAINGSYSSSALRSIFAQAGYTYADKYLAGFSVRSDASRRFGSSNSNGIFPSASIGWRISGEQFMKNVKWISDLKLRASWGQMGNQHILPSNSYDAFTGAIGSTGYTVNSAMYSTNQNSIPTVMGYPDGRWETSTLTNIGLDAVLFGGRTEFILEWYQKNSADLLMRFPYQFGGGIPSDPTYYNEGGMKNNGLDLLITQRNLLGTESKFNIDGSLTFTTYSNEITKITDGYDYYDTHDSHIGNLVRNQVGHSLSSFYGYRVVGLFQNSSDVDKSAIQEGAGPGRLRFADLNGRDANGKLTGLPDGIIDSDDRTFLGDPSPDFSYGLQINMRYAGFDAGLFMYGVQGNEAMNYVKWWTDFYPSFQGNKSQDLLYNSWTPSNPGAKVPLNENVSNFSTNTQVNSYYLEDASYLRLKNLTIGYTLPAKMTNKYKIDKLRFYFQATNLFTITKYSGPDPQIIGNGDGFGIDEGVFPTVKQFVFGLNLNL
jgi:TonB-dependent starch-binding outer membrane protein SusC